MSINVLGWQVEVICSWTCWTDAFLRRLRRHRVRGRKLLLRSEIPSGMCAELRTVAASNNRDHPTRSLYYSLFMPHT